MEKMNLEMAKHAGRIAQKAMEAQQKKHGRPFIIGHFITNRCMCSCSSCLWKRNDWEDVPTDVIKRFYTEAKEEGFAATAFSGGEPFMRKDLGELTKFLKEDLDFPILQFTTGWYLEERMDEILPNVSILMLSLDSAKAEKHDEIRGLPGLYDKLMSGVRLAKKNYPDLPIHFNCCVQKGIEDEIDDLIKLTEDLGLKISFDVITDFRNAGEDKQFTSTEMGMSVEELQRVCGTLVERKRAGAPIVNSERYFKYFQDGKPGYRCHFPKLAMCIDGRGAVEYCLNLDEPIANIKDMPLKEIMELPRFKSLRKDAESCHTCSSPTMIDLSNVWENPQLMFEGGGIAIG